MAYGRINGEYTANIFCEIESKNVPNNNNRKRLKIMELKATDLCLNHVYLFCYSVKALILSTFPVLCVFFLCVRSCVKYEFSQGLMQTFSVLSNSTVRVRPLWLYLLIDFSFFFFHHYSQFCQIGLHDSR